MRWKEWIANRPKLWHNAFKIFLCCCLVLEYKFNGIYWILGRNSGGWTCLLHSTAVGTQATWKGQWKTCHCQGSHGGRGVMITIEVQAKMKPVGPPCHLPRRSADAQRNLLNTWLKGDTLSSELCKVFCCFFILFCCTSTYFVVPQLRWSFGLFLRIIFSCLNFVEVSVSHLLYFICCVLCHLCVISEVVNCCTQ